MIIFQLVPIVLSLLLIFFISSRKGYSKSKIEKQLSGYTIISEGDERKPILRQTDVNHINDIIEDTYIYLGFLCGFATIIISMLLDIVQEIIKKEFELFGIDSLVIIITMLVCFISLHRLWRDKLTKLTQPCTLSIFRKYTYKQVYDFVLILGYLGLAFVLII